MDTSTTRRPPTATDEPQQHSSRPTSADLPPASLPASAPNGSPGPEARRIDLSLTQVVGGSLAAATAAALGSRLGVVGTITGAGLISLVASVAGAVYTTSLQHTRDRVAYALGAVAGARTGPSPRSLLPLRRVLLGAALVFAVTAAGVTGFELVSGRSLSGDTGRTTVSSTVEGSAGSPSTHPRHPSASGHASPTGTPTPTPSPTETATPSPTASPSPTATATSTTTATSTPTSTPTATSTTAPTTGPTAGPTAGPSPTSGPSTGLPVTP